MAEPPGLAGALARAAAAAMTGRRPPRALDPRVPGHLVADFGVWAWAWARGAGQPGCGAAAAAWLERALEATGRYECVAARVDVDAPGCCGAAVYARVRVAWCPP